MTTHDIATLASRIDAISPVKTFGRVVGVQGLLIEVAGIEGHLSVGGRCNVIALGNRRVPLRARRRDQRLGCASGRGHLRRDLLLGCEQLVQRRLLRSSCSNGLSRATKHGYASVSR